MTTSTAKTTKTNFPINRQVIVRSGEKIFEGIIEKKEWDTAQQASKELNIHYGSISCCCLGKTKKAGKFIWRFK